jgi:hypothetical protein
MLASAAVNIAQPTLAIRLVDSMIPFSGVLRFTSVTADQRSERIQQI